MMSADLLVSVAFTALLVLLLRLAEGRDVWPEPSESRFQLGWPRGVQEEEPVRFRTELLTRRASFGPTKIPDGAGNRVGVSRPRTV